MLGYHLQPAGPIHPNGAEHPQDAIPAGMEPSPHSQSRWGPPERRLLGGITEPRSGITEPFLYPAQLFGQPEMGWLIAGPRGIDPKWKCSHPPAAVISVLSNAGLPSTHSSAQQ